MAGNTVDLDPVEEEPPQPGEEFRVGFVSLLAAVIGVLGGVIAFLIYHFIGLLLNLFFYERIGFELVSPWRADFPIWLPLVPAFGGLVVGVMAKYGSPRIQGHGIPEAMEAVWANESRVEPRVMILKPISAAIAIGTGAPFGVEGPIIQTGGSMGSVLGQFISTTVAERKVLLACGATAGMAATFNVPIAGVLISIELLLFEFKARSFIPLSIASIIATGVRRQILGAGALFEMPDVSVEIVSSLPFLIVLGLIIGVAAIVFKQGYFWAEHQLERIPVNDIVLPAVGGLLLGLVGLLVPRVLGVGYEVAEEILANELALGLLVLVVVGKALGVYLTLGSKTSGGFLAPMFVIGAGIGSAFATTMNAIVPGLSLNPSLFALAGLGALFGVAGRATFAFVLFPVEVTQEFEAILPVFLVAVIADGVASMYLNNSLMTEELVERGVDIYQEYEIDPLKRFEVGEVMDEAPATISPDVTVAALTAAIGGGAGGGDEVRRAANGGAETAEEPQGTDEGQATDETQTTDETQSVADDTPDLEPPNENVAPEDILIHEALPIADPEEGLVGIVTYGDLVRALAHDGGDRTAIDVGTTDIIVGYPDERLYEAVVRMATNDIEQLPIVTPDDPDELVGLLDSQNLMTSALRQLEEEYIREEGRFNWRSGLF